MTDVITTTDSTPTTGSAPVRAVVFDLDGTLVDSAPDIARALATVLEPMGGRRLATDQVRGLLGHGPLALVQGAIQASGAQLGTLSTDELTERYLAECRARPVVESRLFDGVEALLSALAREQIACGVCTNKSGDIAVLVLDQLGIGEQFSVVVGADQVPDAKPDPAHLLAVIERLGIAPQACLYVGDTVIDEQAAAAAGVRFAAVPWADLEVSTGRLDRLAQILTMTKAGRSIEPPAHQYQGNQNQDQGATR